LFACTRKIYLQILLPGYDKKAVMSIVRETSAKDKQLSRLGLTRKGQQEGELPSSYQLR
jgi:hypothetical protein